MVKMLLDDGSVVNLKGLHCPTAKGVRYVYHRKTGHRFTSPWGSWELVEEVKAFEASQTTPAGPKPGTLGALITLWRRSPEWASLAPRTRRDYERRAIEILTPWDDVPLDRIGPPLIFKLRDKLAKSRGRRTVSYVLTVFSNLYAWGKPRGLVTGDSWTVPPLPRPKDAVRANRPWEADEREAVLAAAPVHLKVPIALVMFTGLRESDALALPWSVWRDGAFNFSPAKNRYDLWLSPPAELSDILASAPKRAVTIAATSRGTVWTAAGFRASWRTLRISLEKAGKVRPGLTIHGLRHTVGNALAEDGMNTADIARILGHKTERQAAEYSNRTARKDAASRAVTTLSRMGGGTPKERKV